MTAQDTLRHDVLTLRDLVEAREAESASITYSTDPHTVLTYTRDLGAGALRRGELAQAQARRDRRGVRGLRPRDHRPGRATAHCRRPVGSAPVTLAEAPARARKWTHDSILDAAQRWHTEMGRAPTEVDWNPARARLLILKLHDRIQTHVARIQAYEGGGFPSSSTAKDEFGSFSAMVEAAGFESRSAGRQPRELDPRREQELRQHGQFDGPITPAVLAVKLRKLAEARQEGDPWALRASLYELAATAIAWVDQLDSDALQGTRQNEGGSDRV